MRHREGNLSGIAATLAVVALVAALSVQAAAAAVLHWSGPARINATSGGAVYDTVACPTAALCVATDQLGRLEVTSDPGVHSTWHVSRLVPFGSLSETPFLTGLSCGGASVCVGIDSVGEVYSTSDPAGGANAWHAAALPGGDSAAAIACPAAGLCVAPLSNSASVDTATRPLAGSRGWTHTAIRGAPSASPQAISCPSISECVIAADGGRVLTSTEPTAGGASYVAHRITAAGTPVITTVTCLPTGGCLAGDGRGDILTTADPGQSIPWTTQSVAAGAEIRSIGCAPSGGCLAVDTKGRLFARDPGQRAWIHVATDAAAADADQALSAYAVACPADALCLAADGTSGLPRSASPFTSAGWRTGPPRTDGGDRLNGIACPSLRLCVAVGDRGEIVASRMPLRPGSWRTVAADRVAGMRSVSCPSRAFCLATDTSGGAVISTDPGAEVWRRHVIYTDQGGGNGVPTGLQGVSCASAHFCLTGDANPGDLLSATDPWGGPRAWSHHRPGGPGTVIAAACPSTGFCDVVDAGGEIGALVPGGGPGINHSAPGPGFDSVTCTGPQLCAAAAGGFADRGTGGGVWVSTNPAAWRPSWRHVALDASDATAIACQARAICAAVDYEGRALVSIDPGAARPRWETETVDPQAVLTGVACPSPRVCLAVDRDGRLHIGIR